MFQAFGDDAKRQRLHARERFIAVCAIAHHTREGRHFGQAATIIFSLNFDRENHPCTVPPAPVLNKRIAFANSL